MRVADLGAGYLSRLCFFTWFGAGQMRIMGVFLRVGYFILIWGFLSKIGV